MSANITHADLVYMRVTFVGTCMGSILYGINICVYIAAIYFLVKKKILNGKLKGMMFIFATLLFSGATMIIGVGIKINQTILVDSRANSNDPSGEAKSLYLLDPLSSFLNGVYIATYFIADLLLLYRLYVVWGRNIWVVIIPSLIFLASAAFSIISEYQFIAENTAVKNSIITYISLSVTLTIIVTALISFRLMAAARAIQKVCGMSHRPPYVSVVAILIESAALYTIVAIFFIAFDVTGNSGVYVLDPMLNQVMCIAPNLIIARVAAGASFSEDPFTHHTDIPIYFANNYATHGLEAGKKFEGPPPVVDLRVPSLMDEAVISDTDSEHYEH